MRLLETAQLHGVVGVLPAVAVFASLGSPEVHTPGSCHSGIGIASAQFVGALRAHQGIDEVGQRGTSGNCRQQHKGQQHNGQLFAHLLQRLGIKQFAQDIEYAGLHAGLAGTHTTGIVIAG